MNLLINGSLHQEQLDALISLTNIRAPALIAALQRYYIKGESAAFAYHVECVEQQHFSRAVNTLNETFNRCRQVTTFNPHQISDVK